MLYFFSDYLLFKIAQESYFFPLKRYFIYINNIFLYLLTVLNPFIASFYDNNRESIDQSLVVEAIQYAAF